MKTLKNNLILISTLIFSSTVANAAQTEWKELGGGSARVIAVKDPMTSKIEGVIEIQLDRGWKTYWRSPGEAGIPPTFDFSGSRFIDFQPVQFPTPSIIEIPDTYFMGYQGNVKFPFSANSFSSDASLKLNMLAGVCEEICIPATASFEIPSSAFNVSDPVSLSLVEDAKMLLPADPSEEIGVTSVNLKDRNLLEVGLALPDDIDDAKLLVEGPIGWFSGPVPITEKSLEIQVDESLKLDADWRSKFRYTILSSQKAVGASFVDIAATN